MIRLIERWLNDEPADVRLWHKWWAVLPVRLADGRRSSFTGQLWRRWNGSAWEYRQDAESEAEYLGRGW